AAECVGDLGREPAERLALGVDEIPLARDFSRLGAVRLHRKRRTRARRRPIVANARRNPASNSAAPPCDGWRTYSALVAACAVRPAAMAARPRRTSERNGAA